MLQGTGSHVGKTLLTAARCRASREAGRDVAPFKAQNMALNAYVTRDGTYLHSFLDSAAGRGAVLAGLSPVEATVPCDYRALREREYGRLAAHVREHVDLPALLGLVGLR